MNLLPHPSQTNPQKLIRLLFIFLCFFLLNTLVVSPVLAKILGVNFEDIAKLQEKSTTLVESKNLALEEIQSKVMEGAKSIKKELNNAQYWYIYTSQMTYNILCFLLCSLLFRGFAFEKNELKKDWKPARFILYAMSPALLITALPLIGETMKLNDWLGINAVLNYFQLDTNAESIGNMIFTYAVFVPENSTQLIASLFFVALIPALGEELLFRGSLQRIFLNLTGNIHSSILITSLIFSAFHFEITAFFYRFFLGVLLGYTYFWGRTIVLPIIIHATNNALTVLYMYFIAQNPLANSTEISEQNPAFSVLMSSLMAFSILFLFYVNFKREETQKFIE